MREGTNERMYTTTKHITTLLLRSRVKRSVYQCIQEQQLALVIGKQNEQVALVKIEVQLPVTENLHTHALWTLPFKNTGLFPQTQDDRLTQKTSVHLGHTISLVDICSQ